MPNKKFIGVKENNNEQLLLNRIDATKDFFFFFRERERVSTYGVRNAT